MSDQNFATKFLKETMLTRRSFLKWSAALGGTAAMVGGVSVGLKAVNAASEKAASEGEWITAACWHNCGGRCLLQAQVVDGVVTRVKTDDTHPDSPDYPQQRGCVRGRAQRASVFSADRLKYPMKRKTWEPGGGNKDLRGQDEWVRISWDEALDIYASEITRIKEKYGNEAIFVPAGGEMSDTLALAGGFVDRWGQVSWGTWRESYVHFTGVPGSGSTSGNDRLRLRQARLVIMWGANPAVSSNGSPSYHYLQAKNAGAKFIFVDPVFSDTAMSLADEWIPIRPGTDTTMLLGMAYHMITNNLQDQAFLDKYCQGFDAEHMPEGVDSKNNFKDYVLGTYDGQPKTPEWASQISGVPAETIRRLAQELATTKPAVIQTAGAPARINNGECLPQAMLTVAWMTGNLGIPGSGVGPNMHNSAANAGPALVKAGSSGVKGVSNPIIEGSTRQGNINAINNCEMWNAVVTGDYIAGDKGKQKINIQMIVSAGFGDPLNQRAGMTKGIEAFRKVEFVAVQTIYLNTTAKYADLVLPVTTQWERHSGLLTGNRDILIYHRQLVEPLFEAQDDSYIAVEVAKRLGLDASQVEPFDLKQQVYNQLAGATVITDDGSGYEPLLTITAADIAEMGVEGEPQTGKIPYQEFKARGIYQVQRSANDKLGFTELEAYVEDPVANPAGTQSGKLEIYCPAIVDWVGKCGFNTKDPLPKYDPPIEGYEETFVDWNNQVKGDYPLQLYTMHYQRRSHSSFDNVPWLREAFPQEMMMNPVDAAERGIQNGDVALVKSRHGTVVRPVLVTNRITPGVVTLGEGAWAQVDEASGIDMAGATNTLNGDFATGQGHTGHNTCVVQVEKYEGPIQLARDVDWAQRVIF
jgi:anaerobic dimethyl sulfoxide reductase subunit A